MVGGHQRLLGCWTTSHLNLASTAPCSHTQVRSLVAHDNDSRVRRPSALHKESTHIVRPQSEQDSCDLCTCCMDIAAACVLLPAAALRYGRRYMSPNGWYKYRHELRHRPAVSLGDSRIRKKETLRRGLVVAVIL